MSRYCQTSVVSFNRVNNNWRTLVGPKGDRSRLIGDLLNLKFLFFYNYFGTLITGRLIEGGAKRTSLGGRLMGVQTPLSSVGFVRRISVDALCTLRIWRDLNKLITV